MNARLKGFTLIELLIVVAIIAILAAIAVPNLLEAQTRSKVSRVKADMRTYATAIESYAVDNNEYPSIIHLLGPNDVQNPRGVQYSLMGTTLEISPLEEALVPLSTPIAYMTDALITEPFNGHAGYIMYRGYNVIQALAVPPDAGQRNALYTYIGLPGFAESMGAMMIPALVVLSGGTLTTGNAMDIMNRRWFIVSPGPDTFYAFDQAFKDTGDAIGSAMTEINSCTDVSANGVYDPTNGTVSRGEIVRTAAGFFNDKK